MKLGTCQLQKSAVFTLILAELLSQISKMVGEYSRGFITDVPADLNSEFAKHLKETFFKFPGEGIYIYSFAEGRMLYADGWEEVIGLPSSELTMLGVVNFTAPEHKLFVEEVNDKALLFLHDQNRKLTTDHSFTIHIKIMHTNGSEVPVIAKVGVHGVDENGRLETIIGRFQFQSGIKFGSVMRFATTGPEKEEFEKALDPQIFTELSITELERETLSLVKQGKLYKQIADEQGVSVSAIDKRFRAMKARFKLKSRDELITFAEDNFLID